MEWFDRTITNIRQFIDDKKTDIEFEKENRNDKLLLKYLNKELKRFHIKLKLWQYEDSPFSTDDMEVIPIILKYVDMCEKKINKVFLLSSLRSPCFYDVVPYLINFYKEILKDYHTWNDEFVLLSVCETIGKIGSELYINQYIDLLNMTITPSAECIINMLAEMPHTSEIETCIFSLIEKDNQIPEDWMGKLNETDKYYCSQMALLYISKTNNPKYHSFLERFLTPQNLSWIYFTESDCCKLNYSECYKQYIKIASKHLNKQIYIIVRYDYDAWGNCAVDASTTNIALVNLNPFRYRSYYYDTETSLYYLMTRCYDPEIG